LPNILTLSRLIFAFVFLYFYLQNSKFLIIATIVFMIASITDALDGFLARKMNVTSKFGEKLDPIADKTLTIVTFVAFAWQGIVESWMVAIVIFRDIFTTFIRHKYFTKKKIPTSKLAKFKTMLQLIFILFVLFSQLFANYYPINSEIHHAIIYYGMLGVTILAVWSMFEYIFQLIKFSKNPTN
jgi:CDP-diacylglycerol--glycerol-3-phosphate 3-phosphatidyltransferase